MTVYGIRPQVSWPINGTSDCTPLQSRDTLLITAVQTAKGCGLMHSQDFVNKGQEVRELIMHFNKSKKICFLLKLSQQYTDVYYLCTLFLERGRQCRKRRERCDRSWSWSSWTNIWVNRQSTKPIKSLWLGQVRSVPPLPFGFHMFKT